MAIQNISGADAVPQGVLETSRGYSENANQIEGQDVQQSQQERPVEENKGNSIDTTA